MITRLLLAALLLVPLGAGAATKLVAVLPVDAPHAEVSAGVLSSFDESVRVAIASELSPKGYTVLTRENTLRVLADNGLDAAKACEASCALEAARELKATLFVSSSLTLSEGLYVAFVRVLEPDAGRQLAAAKLEGAKVRDVTRDFEARVQKLFADAFATLNAQAPAKKAEPEVLAKLPEKKADPKPVAPVAPPVEASGGVSMPGLVLAVSAALALGTGVLFGMDSSTILAGDRTNDVEGRTSHSITQVQANQANDAAGTANLLFISAGVLGAASGWFFLTASPGGGGDVGVAGSF